MIDPVFINLDYAGARRGRSRRIAAGGDAANRPTFCIPLPSVTPFPIDDVAQQGTRKLETQPRFRFGPPLLYVDEPGTTG